MQLSGLQIQQQAATMTAGFDTASMQQAETKVLSDVVLTGEGVRVSKPTDFEKLLAEMNADRQEKKLESRQSQLAAALATMAGQYAKLTAEQQAALEAVGTASDAVSAATANAAQEATDLAASSAALAVATAELTAMIEASVTTPEDRAKALDAEERDQEITDKALMDKASIAEQQAKVDALEAQVAVDKAALAQAEAEKTTAEQTLATAISALDSTGFRIFVDAALSTAQALRSALAERAVGETLGAKVDAVIEALSAYVEQVEEMREEEMREAIMKITPDLVFLASADSLIPAREMAGRTEIV